MKHLKESTKQELEKFEEEINTNLYGDGYLHFQAQDYTLARNFHQDNTGFIYKYFTILDKQGNPIGFIQMYRMSYRDRVRFGIFIYDKMQGQGYGTRALKEFFELCKSIGIKSIECFTTNKNLDKLYETKLGMRKVGVFKHRKKLMDGKVYSEYLFEKIL